MDNEIRTAISKAMAKLVGFSLNEKKMNGHSIEVALHGRFRHDIWIYPFLSGNFTACIMTGAPKSIDEISKYESEIEKVIAKITANFAKTPAEILATLHSEVNE